MTSCELPRISITDPGDLIETVPYLLGFHPEESLVLIGFANTAMTGPQRIQVTMRVDLVRSFDAELLQPLTDALQRSESAAMAAVLVTDQVAGDPRRAPELMACRDMLAATMNEVGIDVLDVLVASDSHWWSLCCEQLECCPSEGRPRVRGSSAAAAQATFAGLVALPDRPAMAATLAGRPAAQRSRLQAPLAEVVREIAELPADHAANRRRAEVAQLLAAARRHATDAELTDDAELADEQLSRHAVALTDLGVRDALWLAIDDGSVDACRLMNELHSRLPPPYDAAPMFLFGWAQWRTGNGTLAMMAAERVLESQPGYSAAMLLFTAVQRGLDPRTVPALSNTGAP